MNCASPWLSGLPNHFNPEPVLPRVTRPPGSIQRTTWMDDSLREAGAVTPLHGLATHLYGIRLFCCGADAPHPPSSASSSLIVVATRVKSTTSCAVVAFGKSL